MQIYHSWLFGVGKGKRILLLAKAKSGKSFFVDSVLQNLGWICVFIESGGNRRICEVDSTDFVFLRVRFCKFVDSALDSTNPQNSHKKHKIGGCVVWWIGVGQGKGDSTFGESQK